MNSAGSKLEFFIDPPAVGPNAPAGRQLRIERTNPGKRKKIIVLSWEDVHKLHQAINDYYCEVLHEMFGGKPQLSVDNSNSAD